MRLPFFVLAPLLTAALSFDVVSGQQGPPMAPDAEPGQVIVQFGRQVGQAQRADIRAAHAATVLRSFDRFEMQLIRLGPGRDVTASVAALRGTPGVVAAQPNYRRHIVQTPNDPFWTDGSLWGLARIRANEVWTAFTTGQTGIIIADLDTGVNYLHPDLAANMWRNPDELPGNGLDDDGNGWVDDVFGIDVINGDADPMDDHGHGTHTSGTFAAVGNNGAGVVGVTWKSKILACKFLDAQGSGTDSGAIECLDYVVALKQRGVNIRVTNNSWGSLRGTGPVPTNLQAAFDAAGAAGIFNVVAAGNNSVNIDTTPFDPASLPTSSIFTVAASDFGDNRAQFSNYGATSVDLAAPGDGILSTRLDAYSMSSGTSMSTPHVAGAAALLAALDPSLTADGIRAVLLNSVTVLPQWTGLAASGGRLDVYAAATAVAGPAGEASAVFLGTDAATQGTWLGTYGGDGHYIVGDGARPPAYGSATVSGAAQWTWETATSDPRALQRATGSGRLAATWYASAFSINVAVNDTLPHDIALYVIDWDNRGRSQRLDVRDAATGVLLDSRTMSGPSAGAYLRWTVTGNVRIDVTAIAGPNAVLSGVFFGAGGGGNRPPTATLLSPTDGATFTAPATIAISASANDPDGTVTKVDFVANGQIIGSDQSSPFDFAWGPVAPGTYVLTAVASDNATATGTSAPVTVTVNPAGGGSSAVFLGTDPTTQGTWLGTYGGDGHYIVGDGARPPAYGSATVSGAAQWTWEAATSDPRALQRATGSGRLAATWYASAFSINVAANDTLPHDIALYVIDWDTKGRSQRIDVRDAGTGALLDSQTVSSFVSGRYLRWTLTGNVRIDVTAIAGPNAVLSGVFFGAGGGGNRPPTATLLSPTDGATFTAPATIAISASANDPDGTVTKVDFVANGQIIGSDQSSPFDFAWGPVAPGTYVLTAVASDNATATGTSAPVTVTVNPAGGGSSAVFLGMDPTTQGTWLGTYGGDGHYIVGDGASPPAYGSATVSGAAQWTWEAATSDPRALQRATGSGRLAATWYGAAFSINVTYNDTLPHDVALYVIDWDNRGRSQRIDVRDAGTGALLDSQTVSSFVSGRYLRWTVTGSVRIDVTAIAGPNAVLSGVFFGAGG